jgi:cytochrome c556
MRDRPFLTFSLYLLGAGLIAMPAVQAQTRDPAASIDQRQARMKALGASMKTLTAFGKGSGTAAEARKAAGTLAAAGRAMPNWWPRGTAKGVGDSEAAPAIWTDQARFRQQLATFARASDRMDKVAATGNAATLAAELRNVGSSCKGCHDLYRLED